MRVYITGIAGFLGSHLADELLSRGHEVTGCDDLSGGTWQNVPLGVPWTQADVREIGDDLAGVDVVYHCAAHPHEGLSVFSPYDVSSSVFDVSVKLFSDAIRNKVKRIVFCSSMARYGVGENPPPFDETMLPMPQDPYGIAKVAAENVLRSLARVHGIEFVIAVPHNIYGPRQRYIDPFRNVAAIMTNRILQDKPPIIYGDGEQQRSFSYIGDVVEVLARFATDPDCSGQIFNVGPDSNEITIKGLAQAIMNILGVEMEPIYLPARPCEVKYAYCSSNKIREWFNWHPKTTTLAGLTKMVEWIVERGPKPFQYHIPVEIPSERLPATWLPGGM